MENITIEDIKNIDRALYETIDSIMYASIKFKIIDYERVAVSKFSLDLYAVLAGFLETELIKNNTFTQIYNKFIKDIDICRPKIFQLVLKFMEKNCYIFAKHTPRTQDRFTFLTFLNTFDIKTGTIKELDKQVKQQVDELDEMSGEFQQFTLLNLCINTYETFKKIL